MSYRELRDAAAAVAERVAGSQRVAVWATNEPEVAVAVVGALLAGVPIALVNPKAGSRELAHILGDADPELLLASPGAELPDEAVGRERIDVDLAARGGELPSEPPDEAPALVVYTSGTTGPPKGAVLPRRSLASNLDALADRLGVDGRRRRGPRAAAVPRARARARHARAAAPRRGRRTTSAASRALPRGLRSQVGRRCCSRCRRCTTASRPRPQTRRTSPARWRGARLLVSGSAALPAVEHERIERICGQRIVERYGMTETLMNTAVRAGGERRPGSVGPPLDGVDIRLVGDDGAALEVADDETIGEVQVRGPNLFLGYLNRPDATEEALRDGWFRTGDLATRSEDGSAADRRPPRDRPDQERRLQDRRRARSRARCSSTAG